MTKITLVGAGSVTFTKNLVSDLLQYAALEDSTICLMDIDAARLATAEKLVQRIIRQLGVKARVEATTDLRKACTGARFVITTIQVGGYYPSTVADFEIPAKYGVEQTIADTLGVGGVFRALRSIPKLVEVTRMLQEVGARDSLLLNYTNPMAMNMWAIDRLTGQHAVGLCHSVQGTSHQISSYCGFNPKDVDYLVAGINHMAFFLKFEHKGKDAYPYLFRALENDGIVTCDRVRFEMMRRLGYFVTESSEHQSEYNPYFIHHGKDMQERFAVPINEYIRRCESNVGRWEQIEGDLLDESKQLVITKSVEYGSVIVNSIVSGDPSVIYGNVPNTKLITNLQEGCCVEVPCLVDKNGIQPTHIGDIPPQLAAIMRTNINVQELTVEAAITNQREYIYQAVMMDPHTATVLPLDKIWAMCDELIEVHQKDGFLGEFKPVVKNTGKPLSSVAKVFLSARAEGVSFSNGSNTAELYLKAENRTDEAFTGVVNAHVAGGDFAEIAPFNVTVAAGETVEIPFTLTRLSGDADAAVKVVIESASSRTVEQDFILPKRNRFELPVDDSGAKALDFDVVWSGNRAAVCRAYLADGGKEFVLEADVDDTDVKTSPAFWDGSAIELGFKSIESTDNNANQIIIYPDFAAPTARYRERLAYGKIFPGASVTVDGDKSGYKAVIRVKLESVGLQAGCPFLFDVNFHIGALGTAHGKIAQTWQASVDLSTNQSSFAVLTPVAK